MGILITAGALLSWILSRGAGRIALASLIAFLVTGIADTLVFHRLRERERIVRINGSNIAGAALDSLIFPTIAFGVLLPWIILGQFAAKTLGGFVWSLIIGGEA